MKHRISYPFLCNLFVHCFIWVHIHFPDCQKEILVLLHKQDSLLNVLGFDLSTVAKYLWLLRNPDGEEASCIDQTSAAAAEH